MAKQARNPISTTGPTVTVGLKLPNGFILRLQVCEEVPYSSRDGEIRYRKEWHPDHSQKTWVLKGNAVAIGEQPKCLVVKGFAMTSGIPKDFWELWLEQNPELELVKQGLILAHDDPDDARDEAKERGGEIRSGLEPLNMGEGGDIRLPKKRDAKTGKLVDVIEVGNAA